MHLQLNIIGKYFETILLLGCFKIFLFNGCFIFLGMISLVGVLVCCYGLFFSWFMCWCFCVFVHFVVQMLVCWCVVVFLFIWWFRCWYVGVLLCFCSFDGSDVGMLVCCCVFASDRVFWRVGLGWWVCFAPKSVGRGIWFLGWMKLQEPISNSCNRHILNFTHRSPSRGMPKRLRTPSTRHQSHQGSENPEIPSEVLTGSRLTWWDSQRLKGEPRVHTQKNDSCKGKTRDKLRQTLEL